MSSATSSTGMGWLWWRSQPPRYMPATTTIYQLTDRLHDGHTACVPGDEIATTISTWLAELNVHSSLADDLEHAVQTGDWPAAHAIGKHLSIDVTIAA